MVADGWVATARIRIGKTSHMAAMVSKAERRRLYFAHGSPEALSQEPIAAAGPGAVPQPDRRVSRRAVLVVELQARHPATAPPDRLLQADGLRRFRHPRPNRFGQRLPGRRLPG